MAGTALPLVVRSGPDAADRDRRESIGFNDMFRPGAPSPGLLFAHAGARLDGR